MAQLSAPSTVSPQGANFTSPQGHERFKSFRFIDHSFNVAYTVRNQQHSKCQRTIDDDHPPVRAPSFR